MTNEELVHEYQNNNNMQALNDLIEQNTGLVMYFAKQYRSLGKKASFEFDDIVQEGWIGFIDAVNSYDPQYTKNNDLDEGASFSTYAGTAIQRRIQRAINKCIPREKKSDTYSEIIRVNSIDKLLPDSEDTTLEAFIPDEKSMQSYEDIEKNIDNELLRKDLLQLLDSIFGGEFEYNGQDFNGVKNVRSLFDKLVNGITAKEVLLLHYGFFGKPMSFTKIAEKVGLSGSRIEQIETKGIYAIRNHEKGKEFMKKYEIKYIEELEGRKESINQFNSADKVISSIEYIDNLLERFVFDDEDGKESEENE